jgi:dipeptidyl aminopeptidase/acylaminoacyl peptidase
MHEATQSISTRIAQFPESCDKYERVSISNDGKRLAVDCDSSAQFIVIDRDGSRRWTIPHRDQTIVRIETTPEIVKEIYLPGYWSPDGRYIYFLIDYLYPCCMDIVPDYGEFGMSPFKNRLYRLDTLNGFWVQLTPPANYRSFSPTGRRLIYVERKEHTNSIDIHLTTVDLKTGGQKTYILEDYLAAGYVFWSEDGTQPVFEAVRRGSDWGIFIYSFFMVDLTNQSLIRLYTFDELQGLIFPIERTQDNKLVIWIWDELQNSLKTQVLDLKTKQLTDPTPIP